jgi:hypothetical protein
MTVRRWALVTLAVPALVVSAGRSAGAEGSPLRLVDQTFAATLGGPVALTIATDLAVQASDVVRVTVHAPVDDRDAVRAVIAGDLTAPLTSVDVPASSVTVAEDASLRVEVPVDPAGSDGSLEIEAPGLYPTTVELVRDDETLAQLVTFLDVVDDDPPPGTLAVGLIVQVSAQPTLQPDLSTDVDARARAELERLVTLLEATDQTMSLGVGPELLAGLERSGDAADLELLDRIDTGLSGRELLAETYVVLDPSGAAEADLDDVYTAQLRTGEDTLAELLPRMIARRSVFLARTPVDGGGAELVRDLGARTLVLLPAAQAETGGGFALAADPTLLLDVTLPGAAPVPAVVVDARLAETLGAATNDPVLTAHHLMAEMVAMREQIVESLADDADDDATIADQLAGRALVLATPSGRSPEPVLGATLLELLAATPGFAVTTAAEASATMDPFVVDGQRVELPLPDQAGPDLTALAETLSALDQDRTATASMLPPDDPRPAGWLELENVLVANDLTEEERALYVDTIRGESAAVRASVVLPESTTFTLGGRTSTIRLKLSSTADVPLTVLVRMRSAKLTFPEGDPIVELAPQQTTEVSIPVEARSNGTFPVALEVLTPVGDELLGPRVVFTARVTALAGLGQVITVGALLVLVTWWVHHLRVRHRQRRAGLAEPSTRRHPATKAASSTTEQPGEPAE